jgi:pimeloyl-ACP methyl ester carboxylesterase
MSPEQPAALVELADGHRARVYSAGAGDPLLLLHGWSLDRRSFAPQRDALSAAYRVLTFDRRGFGESVAPPDLNRELDDIDRILDALGIERVHLLGVSQAARLALRYAMLRPARLRSLLVQGVVVDGYTPDASAGQDLPLAHYQALARAGALAELREEWLAHPMMSAGIEDPAQRDLLARIVADYQARDLTSEAPPIAPPAIDVLAGLPALALPVLVLTGELETPARKAHAAELVRLAPQAREVMLPRAGHLSNLAAASAYNAAVLAFLDSVSGRG